MAFSPYATLHNTFTILKKRLNKTMKLLRNLKSYTYKIKRSDINLKANDAMHILNDINIITIFNGLF